MSRARKPQGVLAETLISFMFQQLQAASATAVPAAATAVPGISGASPGTRLPHGMAAHTGSKHGCALRGSCYTCPCHQCQVEGEASTKEGEAFTTGAHFASRVTTR